MRKVFIVLCMLILFSSLKAYALIKSNMYILGKNYTCYNNNCYDIASFEYNKKTNTYSINMIIDLMNWNQHEEYKAPYDEGYISHLIYRTTLHKNKISMQCIGFISRKVLVTDINQKTSPNDYLYIGLYNKVPFTIKDLKMFDYNFLVWINWDNYKKTVKRLVNNP